jgi:hypothetical protein
MAASRSVNHLTVDALVRSSTGCESAIIRVDLEWQFKHRLQLDQQCREILDRHIELAVAGELRFGLIQL